MPPPQPFVPAGPKSLSSRTDARGEALSLISGTRLGVYEVTAQIGAGGMGEVNLSC